MAPEFDEFMAAEEGTVKKPVILLIGGIPGVGKSSISGYLAKNLGIDIVLSGDYLREFARPLLSEEDRKIIGVSVYESWNLFGNESRENITRGFLSQGEILNRGMNSVLARAIRNGATLLAETLYFIPSQIETEILEKITSFYIYISQKEVNSQRLLERAKYTHFSSPGKRLSDQLDRYRVMMDYSLEECQKFGIKTFDNLDYLHTREQILQYVKSLY